jgi:CarboxypepD_reg-like domain
MYKTRPLDGVSVLCSCGTGTTTDSNGNYMIRVDQSDSLRFSYLGRATQAFPVSTMNATTGFDIALHVKPTDLNEVRITPRNYYMDSLQNRKDYEKIFNYHKPGLAISDGGDGNVGLDLDQIINMFRFQRNRRLKAFQDRLIYDEQSKSIDHRFTRYLVKKITGLESPLIDTFMFRFRPSFQFVSHSTDYEFDEYIKLAYQDFMFQRGESTEPRKQADSVLPGKP